MSEKSKIEADLDPVGNRSTRPGSKIADEAIHDANDPTPGERRGGAAGVARTDGELEADLDPVGNRSTRPGSKIADQAIEDSKSPGANKPKR